MKSSSNPYASISVSGSPSYGSSSYSSVNSPSSYDNRDGGDGTGSRPMSGRAVAVLLSVIAGIVGAVLLAVYIPTYNPSDEMEGIAILSGFVLLGFSVLVLCGAAGMPVVAMLSAASAVSEHRHHHHHHHHDSH